MRVYEFSKQSGIPTKELLAILTENGFHINSHMSVLTQDAVDFLEKKFKKAQEPIKIIKKKEASPLKHVPTPLSREPMLPSNQESKNIVASPATKESITTQETPSKTEAPVTSAVEKKIEKSTTSSHSVAQFFVEPMNVATFAEKIHRPVVDVIMTLLKWGVIAAKNHVLTEDIVSRLARHYEIEVVAKPKEKLEEEHIGRQSVSSVHGASVMRPPVVVVLGHVDHGKTTLLDFIRKTRVASKEKGGITQHLGAYEATTPQGNIVFIDTPGHEAFSKIRTRGIKVADVVVLVVAADDGVMPQTIEAIKQAKAMAVPMIVAVNKIDKVDVARLEVIRRELSQHGVLSEDWGGDVVMVPLSAKTGQGVDQLLDMIILQSQLMELSSGITGLAQGYVLESKLEKGRGPVATLLCQQGTLKVGDHFVCGASYGKVTSLVDSLGRRVHHVTPSIPVQVAGFSQLPNAGDYFEVVSQQDYKKAIKDRVVEQKPSPGVSFIKSEAFNIVIKTDSNSSKEAILGSLQKLSKKFEKKFNVVYSGVGPISESDVDFAHTTGASIWTLHVKPEPSASVLAHKEGVTIHVFDIIYKLLEALEALAESAKKIKMIKTKIGEAVVRQVFAIKGLGVIAGCYVNDGRFSKDGFVAILRNNRKIGEGKIKSLQRDKKAVKEVHNGYECGFLVDGYEDFQVDDRVECFIDIPETPKK